jgi:hypothetical protein
MGDLSFTVELVTRGPAAAVVLTDEQVETVGEGAKRFPVAATINGYTWRSTVVRMGDPAASSAYEKLAYTHRKEFARWIEEAKREETRARRVEQAVTMLREGRTRS